MSFEATSSHRTYLSGLGLILGALRPTYEQELQELGTAYKDALAADLSQLDKALARLGSGPASFIASGGMGAVATLSAQLHEHACLEPGAAITPLEAISRPALTASGAVLFTSSGKHPDAIEVMRRLGRPGLRPGVVVTHRPEQELPDLPEVEVVVLPGLPVREGFLAVNSVLSMCVAMVRGYLGQVLPPRLNGVDQFEALPSELDRLLVIHPPSLKAAAVDLETRLNEIGLAAVQVADYRNFAHGRHTGLARNSSRTCVLALSDTDTIDLADATIDALPPSIAIRRWHVESRWPESALWHLIMSMKACGTAGLATGLDIGRPGVPEFGRKLYRLPVRRRLPDQVVGSVDRKLRGVGGISGIVDLRAGYEDELLRWTEGLADRRFKAVVLDYDGTVCSTQRRFQPPSPALTKRLVTLLEDGLLIGFASGRGPSLPEALKKVIPESLWPQITVGMYNGGALYQLDEELDNHKNPSALIVAAKDRLASLPIARGLKLTARRQQLTVEVAEGMWLKDGLLLELVNDAFQRAPVVDVKVVASGHSVDVVSPLTSKVSVIQRLSADLLTTDVLCIGDQGQVGGNDFELLAEQPWSLSVDRTSADPTRCWFLGDGTRSGPELLHVYLGWLGKRRDGFAFKVNGR